MLCETVVQQQLFTQSVAEKKPLQAALLRLGENWIANWSREPVSWDLEFSSNSRLLAKKSTISSTAWKIVKRLNCPHSTISMFWDKFPQSGRHAHTHRSRSGCQECILALIGLSITPWVLLHPTPQYHHQHYGGKRQVESIPPITEQLTGALIMHMI